MNQSIMQSKLTADILVLVLDVHLYTQRPTFLNNDLPHIQESLTNLQRPLLIVLNKVDAFADKTKILPIMDELQRIFPHAEIVPCSTFDPLSLSLLKQIITNLLPYRDPLFGREQS